MERELLGGGEVRNVTIFLQKLGLRWFEKCRYLLSICFPLYCLNYNLTQWKLEQSLRIFCTWSLLYPTYFVSMRSTKTIIVDIHKYLFLYQAILRQEEACSAPLLSPPLTLIHSRWVLFSGERWVRCPCSFCLQISAYVQTLYSLRWRKTSERSALPAVSGGVDLFSFWQKGWPEG